MLDRIIIENEKSVLNRFGNIVFEGGQGLLLDWMNREYMPYLTASRTGLFNVNRLIKLIDSDFDFEVCYMTRSYFTRHGAGPLMTEVENKEVLGITENDKTNFLNPWQGVFRYGYFDLDLFRKTIEKDLLELELQDFRKSICVTHLDETNEFIMVKNEINIEKFMDYFVDFNFYFSYCPDSEKLINLVI
jgi:adenylosuccinate synthase